MNVGAAMATLKGRRSSNQDRAAVALPWVFVLDGVGGSQHGDTAAQVALAKLLQITAAAPRTFPTRDEREDYLRAAAEAAHDSILSKLRGDDGRSTGSTTLSLAHFQLLDEEHVDLMALLIGDGPIWIAGTDRTSTELPPVLVNPRPPDRPANVLQSALGWRLHAPEIHTVVVPVPGRVVLCTDGVTKSPTTVRTKLIKSLSLDPHLCASALTRAALDAGGRDNATAVVVDFGVSGEAATDCLNP